MVADSAEESCGVTSEIGQNQWSCATIVAPQEKAAEKQQSKLMEARWSGDESFARCQGIRERKAMLV